MGPQKVKTDEIRRAAISVGRVIIPSDMNRNEYLRLVYRTHQVDIQTSDGDYIRRVPIAWNFCGVNEGFVYSLEFPSSSKQLGSQVVMIRPDGADTPIIIGAIPLAKNKIHLSEEHQLKISQRGPNGNYLIEGRGLAGVINLFTTGKGEDEGQINLATSHDNRVGKISLSSDYLSFEAKEQALIQARNEFLLRVQDLADEAEANTLQILKGQGLTFTDEFSNFIRTREGNIEMGSEEILIGEGADEQATLGNKLNEFLDEFIGICDKMASDIGVFSASVAAAAATPPLTPLNPPSTLLVTNMQNIQVNIVTLKTKISNHLSEIVKVKS